MIAIVVARRPKACCRTFPSVLRRQLVAVAAMCQCGGRHWHVRKTLSWPAMMHQFESLAARVGRSKDNNAIEEEMEGKNHTTKHVNQRRMNILIIEVNNNGEVKRGSRR